MPEPVFDLVKALRALGREATLASFGDSITWRAADELERLRLALRVIATLPLIEQDNMLSANMRKVAQEALDA